MDNTKGMDRFSGFFSYAQKNMYPLFWIIILCLSVTNLSILYYTFFGDGVMSAFSRTLYSVADSLLLFFPFIFCRRRYLYLVPVWFTVLSALELSNILYFRNFQDAISGISYFSTASFNGFVFDSAKSSLKSIDSVFLLTPALSIFITVATQRSKSTGGRKLALFYVIAMMIALSCQTAMSLRRISIFNNMDTRQSIAEYREGFRLRVAWKEYMMDYGFTGYMIRAAKECMQPHYILSDSEKKETLDFWRGRRLRGPVDNALDSALSENRNKNLILIIVESLNSKVFRLPYATDIIPTTYKLSEDTDVLYFSAIETMTAHGRSSDGQFMYNTGLLPLREEALVSRYANADYPSLAKTLGCRSIEIIGEDGSLWSHSTTTKSYGFDRLIDKVAPFNTSIALQDSLIFSKAMEIADSISGRFFLQITTLGMHKPYTRDTGVTLALKSECSSVLDRHYLEATHAFDRGLCSFLRHLKASGVYDRSIIVIVADHEEMYPTLSNMFDEKRIPMLILNSGIPRESADTVSNRQIDVFPTLLDITGHTDTSIYRGLGRSMIRKCNDDSVPLEILYKISERTIRSQEMLEALHSVFGK